MQSQNRASRRTVGSAPTLDRKKGFEEVIAGNPKLKVIRSQTGDFISASSAETIETKNVTFIDC